MLTMRIPTVNFKFLAGALSAGAIALGASTGAHAATVTPQQIVDDGATGVQLQYKEGDTIRNESAGAANSKGAPIRDQSHFRAGSVSKIVVSSALLQLVEQGKVSLDTPIDTYLPGAYVFGKEVTVRQILNQTSGIPTAAYEGQFPYDAEDVVTLKGFERYMRENRKSKDITQYINTTGLKATPGAQFQYSNANYFIASQLITAASKTPYQVYVAKNIFKPLGMRDSSFPTHRLSLPVPFTSGYQPSEFYSGTPGGEPVDLTRQSGSFYDGSGNLVTTTGDLNKFMSALSGAQVISKESLAIMQTSGAPEATPYGLGMMQFDTPCGVVRGHGGNVYGYTTSSYYLGQKAVSISVTEGSAPYASHTNPTLQLATETLCPGTELNLDTSQAEDAARASGTYSR